jgi:hypothetical protein
MALSTRIAANNDSCPPSVAFSKSVTNEDDFGPDTNARSNGRSPLKFR